MGLVKVAIKKDLVLINLKSVEVKGKEICLVARAHPEPGYQVSVEGDQIMINV